MYILLQSEARPSLEEMAFWVPSDTREVVDNTCFFPQHIQSIVSREREPWEIRGCLPKGRT